MDPLERRFANFSKSPTSLHYVNNDPLLSPPPTPFIHIARGLRHAAAFFIHSFYSRCPSNWQYRWAGNASDASTPAPTSHSPAGYTSSLLLVPESYADLSFVQRTAVTIPRPGENTKPSIKDPTPPVLPGSESRTNPQPEPPAKKPESPISPAPKVFGLGSDAGKTDAKQVPLEPPKPTGMPRPANDAPPEPTHDPNAAAPAARSLPSMPSASAEKKTTSTIPPASSSPPPPPPTSRPKTSESVPPPPPPPKKHQIRNFFIGSTLLAGGLFAGGVFYSLKSDNVHDFFTEYIPFGEEAVLYFEEREFKRRFPNALKRIEPKGQAPRVTIPKSSGATWRLAHEDDKEKITDVGRPGPHLSAKRANEQLEERKEAAAEKAVIPSEKHAAKAEVIDRSPPLPSKDLQKVEAVGKPGKVEKKSEKADNAVAGPTKVAISDFTISDVKDPIVQDLVKAVNEIIHAVNSSNSSSAYGAAVAAAKSELEKLNTEINTLKSSFENATAEVLRDRELEFSKAAQGLLQQSQNAIEDVEHKWRSEFEAERSRITQAYREKLATELERSHQISEQRLHNELLEQAIELKRQFVASIHDLVENERSGRLGKLKELEDAVKELEGITNNWTSVVDRNLKTQALFTAVEAVKASYESPDQPKPFLREIAALREVAADDEVIAAAIASINPRAYQTGVSTHTQLIDRFRRVAEEVRKAALLPEDAGIAAHAGNWLLSKLMFRRSGLAAGEDVESVLTRAETYLEEGDVDSAAREVNQLRGWARILATDWLKEARLLLELQQALDVIAAEARVQSWRVQK